MSTPAAPFCRPESDVQIEVAMDNEILLPVSSISSFFGRFDSSASDGALRTS